MSLSLPVRTPDAPEPEASRLEVSVVIPCLNEADTLAACVRRAQLAMTQSHIAGEVIVADNGSTDGSDAIAAQLGARIVAVPERGYGSALMGGIAAARGKYIIMGDADQSYDFLEIPNFVERLRQGDELVQGCRLEAGGGKVLPGAMPFLHRRLGNPLFSLIARHWFGAPVKDVYCGLRAFTKDLPARLGQRCTGMEFAAEMIIKASLRGIRMSEVPIVLHPDGRAAHAPHLKTFRDGWRTLRFFLMFSPRWLFLLPGLALILLGLAGYGIAMPNLRWGSIAFDAHTLLFASLAVICGYQSILFAVFAKVFAIAEGLLPLDRRMTRLFELVNLERGVLAGAAMMALGVTMLALAINQWRLAGFGSLDYGRTMRWVIPGVTLTALGFQTVLSSFFLSILSMRRR